MYKVLCDGTLMCDSRIEELALINPVVALEENKAGSFSFTIPPAHSMYNAAKKRKSLIEVYQDDETEPLFSGICVEETKDFYNQKNLKCEGELTFFNDSVQRPARYQGVTVRGLLEAYVAVHNAQVEEAKQFTVGQVTVTDPNDYLYCYTNMESTMKALKSDLVDDLGGFFRIRHVDGVRYLDYLAESPNTNSQIIELGKNLLDFTSNIDSANIATAIIPLGAKLEESTVEGLETRLTLESVNDGLDYVHSADAVAAYGWIYKTVVWDDVTTPEVLKQKGEQYQADIQFENVVIQAKAVDLHLQDKEIEQFKILDQIRVKSPAHGLNRYFRLTKQTLNLNNPEKDTVTLGKNERLSLSAKSNQASEEIKKVIAEIIPADHILKNAVANATQLITQSMNGYITTVMNEDGSPEELLIMDTPDIKTATKVWRWNINGLGYSSTGYNGEYALAMTMDGTIVGERIAANSISAKQLKIKCVEQGNVSSEISTEEGTVSIKGNRLEIESDNFTLTKDGTVSATGEFTTTKETLSGYLAKASMKGSGFLLESAENESDEFVKNVAITLSADNHAGMVSLYDADRKPRVQITGENNHGFRCFVGDSEDSAILVVRLAANSDGTEGRLRLADVDGNYSMLRPASLIIKNQTIVSVSEDGARIGHFDRLAISGGAAQAVEWVWDSTLQRWVLCTVT